MIDTRNEPLMPLKEARQHPLLRLSGGRSPVFCTVLSYVRVGVRGVKLEAVSKPSGLFTSELAIERFIELLTAAEFPESRRDTPKQRKAAIDRAADYLSSHGM